MNRQFEMVKQFHAACSVEMPETPTLLDGGKYTHWNDGYALDLNTIHISMKVDSTRDPQNQVLTRSSYMIEELLEFIKAKTIEDQADALIDLAYFLIGTFTLMGVKPEPIFDLVQAANMRKVIDGKVLRNVQGKIVKPDGWYGPEKEIKAEIRNQEMNAYYAKCGITEEHLSEIRKMQQEWKKME